MTGSASKVQLLDGAKTLLDALLVAVDRSGHLFQLFFNGTGQLIGIVSLTKLSQNRHIREALDYS